MQFEFKTIPSDSIKDVIPLVKKYLSKASISEELLLKRFRKMVTQNYECVGVFDENHLVGVCGLWYATRHYSGQSVELDHVVIEDDYRNNGLGTQFINWIQRYVKSKGYQAIELNAYIDKDMAQNFWERNDYKRLGYHYVKKV